MEEPIGAALAAIAEAIGTSDESLRLLIGLLGMGLLATSFTKSNEAWTGPIAVSYTHLTLPTKRIV